MKSDRLKTGIEALADDQVDVKIAVAPDLSVYDGIQNALITMAESTQKFIALISISVKGWRWPFFTL